MMAWLLDGITILLIILGTLLFLIAGIGLVRMPDLYLRMSAATKAATLGSASLLVAAAIHFGELSLIAQVTATIFFLFLTGPVGAHVVGRAAYRKDKAPLYEGTRRDDLKPYLEKQRRAQAADSAEN